jgi:ribosome-associated translation inhibitor RaiA
MKIELLSRVQEEDHDHQSLVQRQVRLLLDRFTQRLRGLRIRLVDENGPKGGVDQRCLVTADLISGGKLHTEARSAEVTKALDQALRRLTRLLSEKPRRRASKRRIGELLATGD